MKPGQTPSRTRLELERLLRVFQGQMPGGMVRSSQSVLLGAPLHIARPIAPLKPQYCPQCQLDVFTNPAALVFTLDRTADPLDDTIRVACDCGAMVLVKAYLFE